MQSTQQIKHSRRFLRSLSMNTRLLVGLGLVTLGLLSGCQGANPAGPTAIPSVSDTLPAPNETGSPVSLLHPVITATGLAPTAAPVVEVPTALPTPGPFCYAAKKGDPLLSLASKAGYNQLDVLPAIRDLNKMCPTCNDIQEGKTYCVPRQTPTPTAPGYEVTQTAQARELPTLQSQSRIAAIATYTVVEGDTIIGRHLKTGSSLREICTLNNPTPAHCTRS